MKTIILIFLSICSIANCQNKKANTAIRDYTLKIPKGYTKQKSLEPYLMCGTDDYTYVPDAENYAYGFYKKENQVYCQGKLTDINGDKFRSLWFNYYKNNDNVYYYTRELGLQRIPGIDAASTETFSSFIADKNYLYIKTFKVIERQDLKIVSDYISYKEAIPAKNTDNNSNSSYTYVNYYLLKNIKGYWIVKLSDVVSYNFLGKTYNHKWDVVYQKEKVEDEVQETVYNAAGIDVKPEFPGGISKFQDFVDKKFKVDEKDLSGKIYSTFIVEKNGSLSDIKILRDLGYGTGKELIRVLKLSPKWKPGLQNGQKVRCLYAIPYRINSSLDH
ncbi:DKNYY domain-containing protein [uncultured Flavobacterium sp.]|uniref:energy transducer TonB n=1 Tax=uncultured Flavobacterium sp. TaxID=165435 RepID=UPI0030817844